MITCKACKLWGRILTLDRIPTGWGECYLENTERVADVMPDTHEYFGCILGESNAS